jgi:hypothetical protein
MNIDRTKPAKNNKYNECLNTGHPNTGHPNTGHIWKPDKSVYVFWMVYKHAISGQIF